MLLSLRTPVLPRRQLGLPCLFRLPQLLRIPCFNIQRRARYRFRNFLESLLGALAANLREALQHLRPCDHFATLACGCGCQFLLSRFLFLLELPLHAVPSVDQVPNLRDGRHERRAAAPSFERPLNCLRWVLFKLFLPLLAQCAVKFRFGVLCRCVELLQQNAL